MTSNVTGGGDDDLRAQIDDLQQALKTISSGGVDAVVVGPPGEERIYTLDSADRPYRVIVESMGEGSATVSDKGIVLFVNQHLAGLLGMEREDILGRRLTELVAEQYQDILTDLLRAGSAETSRAEVAFRAQDAWVPALVSVTGLDIDGALVRCVVVTDLTMQRRIDTQLALHAAEAEQRARDAQVAREVNDTIVQGLVAAEMAFDLGQPDRARNLMAATSAQARAWISDLLGEPGLQPGIARRNEPANPHGGRP